MEENCLIDYNNTCIYLNDINYIKNKEYLNDNCINIILKYYEINKYKINNNILFLDPTVTSHILIHKLDYDDINDLNKGIKFNIKKYIFIICSNQDEYYNNSTHWSLLIINNINKEIYSLDSSFPLNSYVINKLTHVLCLQILSWYYFHCYFHCLYYFDYFIININR